MSKETIKTVYRSYSFDTRKPDERAAWETFRAERAKGPHCFGPVFSDVYHPTLDGRTLDLETTHLFNNQWNTAGDGDKKGMRVFDWALQSDSAPRAGGKVSAPHGIMRGHYLEQTADMRAIRDNTSTCGYCGKQEPAAKGYVFCPHCLDSEYLKASDLHLTRMVCITDTDKPRAKLTQAESAHLLPHYKDAQLHGTTARGKARIAKRRADIAATYANVTRNAKTEHDGKLWLLDHGITADPIFYNHTGRFGFGWRDKGLETEIVSGLLEIIGEFPFPYDIKCADGKTLSGN